MNGNERTRYVDCKLVNEDLVKYFPKQKFVIVLILVFCLQKVFFTKILNGHRKLGFNDNKRGKNHL